MLVAAAFANIGDVQKIAQALGRYGLRAMPTVSGAQVLRQSASVTLVVCGPHLADMTVRRLRQLLPPSTPILLIAAGEMSLPGVELLPCGITKSQLAACVLRRTDQREATVARAKRVLIRNGCADEAQAHRLLQTRAMNTGTTLLYRCSKSLIPYCREQNERPRSHYENAAAFLFFAAITADRPSYTCRRSSRIWGSCTHTLFPSGINHCRTADRARCRCRKFPGRSWCRSCAKPPL